MPIKNRLNIRLQKVQWLCQFRAIIKVSLYQGHHDVELAYLMMQWAGGVYSECGAHWEQKRAALLVTNPTHVHASYNCPESKGAQDNTVREHVKDSEKPLLCHNF